MKFARIAILASLAVLGAAGCGAGLERTSSQSASTATTSTASTSTGSTSTGQTSTSAQPAARLVAKVAKGRLPAALSGVSAATLGGAVYVVGGLDAAGASSDSVTRVSAGGAKVATAGPLGLPLHDAAAAALGNNLLVFGGGSSTTVDYVQTLPGGGQAQLAGHLPSARSDSAALAIGGKAYVLGGFDGNKVLGEVLATSSGKAFKQVATLPVPVRYGAAAAVGKAIYVLGGELDGGSDTNAIQGIDTATGKARIVAHLPTALSHASAIALGGRVFLLGGRVGGVSGSATDRIVSFDPRTGRVADAGRLPMPIDDGAARVLGGTALLAGGLDKSGSPLASVVTLRLK